MYDALALLVLKVGVAIVIGKSAFSATTSCFITTTTTTTTTPITTTMNGRDLHIQGQIEACSILFVHLTLK